MSEIHSCPICKGAKIVIGMGGMRKACVECGGVGFIEKNINPAASIQAAEIAANSTAVIKRRGRKPKEIQK